MPPKDYKEEADKIAKSRGGFCLSEKVLGVWAVTEWSCGVAEHPSWSVPFVQVRGGLDIKKGSWCPDCSPTAKVKKEEYLAYARRFGGKLIRMANSPTEISDWRCGKCKLEFHRSFTNMRTTQTFCDICSRGLSERLCKSALEQLFGVEFKKYRPKDLRGTGGGPLEIGDMYNAELKLAVEQHKTPRPHWGNTDLSKQKEHDRRRRVYCKKKGITLIEIWLLTEDTKLDQFKDIIKAGCLKGGVPLPDNFDEIEIEWGVEGLKTQQENQNKRLKQEEKKRKWKLLTKSFLGVLAYHKFICDKGHPIEKKPTDLWSQNEGYRDCYELEHLIPILVAKGSD